MPELNFLNLVAFELSTHHRARVVTDRMRVHTVPCMTTVRMLIFGPLVVVNEIDLWEVLRLARGQMLLVEVKHVADLLDNIPEKL